MRLEDDEQEEHDTEEEGEEQREVDGHVGRPWPSLTSSRVNSVGLNCL